MGVCSVHVPGAVHEQTKLHMGWMAGGGGGGGGKVGTVFEASQPVISPEISLSAHSRSS